MFSSSSPVFVYQRGEEYQGHYKWDKVLWETLPVHDVDDVDKLSKFFFNKTKHFYELYTSDTYVEKCVGFLDKCKNRGFTMFISVAFYYRSYSYNYGTHYIVACKENDENKLSHILELIGKKKPANLQSLNESASCVLTNYRRVHDSNFRSFFEELRNDATGSRELPLYGTLPSSSKLCDELIKRYFCIFRNAKYLASFLGSRLAVSVTLSGDDNTTIEVTNAVLKTHLANLVNGAPPSEIKQAQEALNIQIYLLNKDLKTYLRRSEYTDDVKQLDNLLIAVISAVQSLNYGMENGTWCIFGDGNTNQNVINNAVIHIPHSRRYVFNDMFPKNSYVAYKKVSVNKTNANDDFIIDFEENKKYPLSFIQVDASTRNPITSEELDRNTFHYVAPCSCGSHTKYHWICSTCQAIVRETPYGDIMCSCGILDKNSFKQTCSTCFSFIETSTSIDMKRVEQHYSASITIKTSFEKVSSPIIKVPKPLYRILVVGASGAGKSTLLNSINCMEHFKSYDEAARGTLPYLLPPEKNNLGTDLSYMHQQNQNESYARPGQSVTQRPKDYNVKFRHCNVTFIDTPGIADSRGPEQDAQNLQYIMDHIVNLPYINGIMFVVKNTEPKLSTEFENVIRSLIGLLPRSAVQNCCFVYTFSSADDYNPGAAQKPLTTLFNTFKTQHDVPNVFTDDNQFCVDNAAWRQLTNTGAQYVESFQDCWNASKRGIYEMIDYIEDVDPIKQKHLQIVANMVRLNDAVVKEYRRDAESPQTRQIMASIAEWTISGKAIYFRNKKGDATPLQNNQWKDVARDWQNRYPDLVPVLNEIHRLLNEHPSNAISTRSQNQVKTELLDETLGYFTGSSTTRPDEHGIRLHTSEFHSSGSSHSAPVKLLVHERPRPTLLSPSRLENTAIVVLPSQDVQEHHVSNHSMHQRTILEQSVGSVSSQWPQKYPERNIPINYSGPTSSALPSVQRRTYNVVVISTSTTSSLAFQGSMALAISMGEQNHLKMRQETPTSNVSSYIVDFGSINIRFMNLVADSRVSDDLKQITKTVDKLHVFILLGKTKKEIDWLFTNVIYALFPKSALNNISIVEVCDSVESHNVFNTTKPLFQVFDQTLLVGIKDAGGINDSPLLERMKRKLNEFTKAIQVAEPIASNDFIIAGYMKQLADELRPQKSSPPNQRLWATIDEHVFDEEAAKKKSNARALADNELRSQAKYWKQIGNRNISAILQCVVDQNNSNSEEASNYHQDDTAIAVRRSSTKQALKSRSKSKPRF